MRKIFYIALDFAIIITVFACYNTHNATELSVYQIPFMFGFGMMLNDYLTYIRHRIQNETAIHKRIGVYSDPNWHKYAQNRVTITGNLHPRLVGFELAILSAFLSPIVPLYSAIEKVSQNGCIQAREALYVLILSVLYGILVLIRIFTVIKPSYSDEIRAKRRRNKGH